MIFRIALWLIGMVLATASRVSARVRAQCAVNVVMAIGSSDGVQRSYFIENRRITSRAGLAENAGVTLIFQSAAQGCRILLAKNAIQGIVEGLARRELELRGEAPLVLWFYEMLMGLIPGRNANERIMPEGYVSPNLSAKVADRITREPVAESLDPSWRNAVVQNEKLMLSRVARGEPIPGKFRNFKHVVDVPDISGESA